jgi:hypothetical protein
MLVIKLVWKQTPLMLIRVHQNAAGIIKLANGPKSLRIVEYFKIYKTIILLFSYNGDGILHVGCQMMGNVHKASRLILSIVLRYLFVWMRIWCLARKEKHWLGV